MTRSMRIILVATLALLVCCLATTAVVGVRLRDKGAMRGGHQQLASATSTFVACRTGDIACPVTSRGNSFCCPEGELTMTGVATGDNNPFVCAGNRQCGQAAIATATSTASTVTLTFGQKPQEMCPPLAGKWMLTTWAFAPNSYHTATLTHCPAIIGKSLRATLRHLTVRANDGKQRFSVAAYVNGVRAELFSTSDSSGTSCFRKQALVSVPTANDAGVEVRVTCLDAQGCRISLAFDASCHANDGTL